MSDDQPTYSAREIVLELFPATPKRLIPAQRKYTLAESETGTLLICINKKEVILELSPVTAAGKPSSQLCCDFCQHRAPRHYLALYRARAGTNGRRFCYVSLCRDHKGCELRRLDDSPIEALLARVEVK